MSAIGNIVAFDGATTPVSHTLVPISVTRERGKVTAVYREKITTLPDEAQVFRDLHPGADEGWYDDHYR